MRQTFKMIKEKLGQYRLLVISLGLGGVIVNLSFYPSVDSQALLILIFYWILIGIIYKTSEKFFFFLALLCLILTVPFFLFKNMIFAERFSVWEFLFICLGLWQYFYLEVRNKLKK